MQRLLVMDKRAEIGFAIRRARRLIVAGRLTDGLGMRWCGLWQATERRWRLRGIAL